MNDVQHFEAARNLAQRMLKEGGASPAERLAWAWKVVTAREPSPEELAIAGDTLTKHLNRYESDEKAAAEAITYGESKADPSLNPTELAAYTMVANLVLNLDETLSH